MSIYDSCQHLETKVDENRSDVLFKSLVSIAKNPMKEIWRKRGRHHTRLVLDGVIKYRCIFKDFDPLFEANEQDYDNTERILVGMVKNWDFDMSIRDEWRGGSTL